MAGPAVALETGFEQEVSAEAEVYDISPLSKADRALTEVDNLINSRLPDGTIPDDKLEDTHQNLTTAVLEGGVPHAVSTVKHEYKERADGSGYFQWLGKTAVESAMGGYRFHKSKAARERVHVEVDEAKHSEQDLRLGVKKVFISPRMSAKDADSKTAKDEHLADDDAVRVKWLEADSEGNVKEKVTESLLVTDIPLGAWNSWLEDQNNMFGKSIELEDPDSALSAMKAHPELEVPMDQLEDGPVDIVRAVLPYIEDPEIRQSVQEQIDMFESDQAEITKHAERIAERWLKFEMELAESLENEWATPEIENFISSMQKYWIDDHLAVINKNSRGQGYKMDRELASILERARQNTLWSRAAVVTGNQKVIQQIKPDLVEKIKQDEMAIQAAWQNGYRNIAAEAAHNQAIASQNIKVGGGCPGEASKFKEPWEEGYDEQEGIAGHDWRKDPKKWRSGVCRIRVCPTRPGSTQVGPCDVCTGCQAKFDAGKDPSRS